MKPRHLPAALAITVLPLWGATAAPASAERASVTDAAADVSREPTGRGVPRGDDGESSADIREVTVAHSTERVRLTVRVRDLRPDEGGLPGADEGGRPGAWGYLRTPDGSVYEVGETSTGGGARYGALWIQDGRNSFLQVECDVRVRRSPLRDQFTFGVPRTCLGDPAWVLFGATTDNQSDDWLATLVDDARREGRFRGQQKDYGPRIGGPRVYAGARR